MAKEYVLPGYLGDACAELREPERERFIYAVNMYCMYGDEIELEYPLNALFIAVKEDVDKLKADSRRDQ